jgi:Na+/H+ antiporter NhaD/arsenite permease-like protein
MTDINEALIVLCLIFIALFTGLSMWIGYLTYRPEWALDGVSRFKFIGTMVGVSVETTAVFYVMTWFIFRYIIN